MSPQIRITDKSYSPIIPLQFKGEIGYNFQKNEYNPNILNDTQYNFAKNENHEKIQKYIEGFQAVYNTLFDLSKKYELGSISIEDDIDKIYNQVFVVNIPNGYDFRKALKVWDDIIDELEQYCIINGFTEYYENILIILK